jgi:hypothetical protein
MSKFVISVDRVSKCYRIGAKEESHNTFREVVVDGLKAPIRNFRRLRRLTRFEPNEHDHRGELKAQGNEDVIWAKWERDFIPSLRGGRTFFSTGLFLA